MLRQHAVFHRPEQGRLNTEAGEHDQQAGHTLGQEGCGCGRHQQHLGHLVGNDNPGLGEPVGELAGRGGKQDVGRDEQGAGKRRQTEQYVVLCPLP